LLSVWPGRISQKAETDFWEILLKLDSSSGHKKKLSAKHLHSQEGATE